MKLRRLATACFAALMAVATLATSASAAEGYVEYPGGENPLVKYRIRQSDLINSRLPNSF